MSRYSFRTTCGEGGDWGSSDAPPATWWLNTSKASATLWSVGISIRRLGTAMMILCVQVWDACMYTCEYVYACVSVHVQCACVCLFIIA